MKIVNRSNRSDTGTAMIDTWVMSCRVLARGMEEYICSKLVALCREQGIRCLHGSYVPTKKNGLVSDLYSRLSFNKICDEADITKWTLDVTGTQPEFVHHIAEDTAATGVEV